MNWSGQRERLSGRLARRIAFGALLTAATLCGSASSFAEPSASDRETARAAMNEGDRLYAAKDYAGALSAYSAAHAIMHVPTTGIEVAKAQESLGMLVEARDTLLQITRTPPATSEPKPFTLARQKAADLAPQIAARIPSLVILVSGAPEGTPLAVKIDGVAIPQAALSQPRKINPGKHLVEVSATGYAPVRAEVVVRERETAESRITLQSASNASATASAPPAPSTTVPPVTPSSTPQEPKHGTPLLAYIGFGLGGAGILAGSITGLLAFSKASDAKSVCTGNSCPPAAESDIDSSKTLGTVSTIAFAVGVAGVGLGVYALVAGPKKEDPSTARGPRVRPLLGLGTLGLGGEF